MAWLTGWSYAKEISLTGQTGAGTLYQVDLDIGDSAGGDFHCEGHCTNFPQDIEVTDNDGTTLLDFFIEDITADPLKMWVEPTDDLGSNQKIWVYYGKSGATTNSDIDATFLFGDDFPGVTLDTANNWTIVSGTPTVNNGLSLDDGERIKTKTWTGNTVALRAKATYPNETGSTVYSILSLYDDINQECSFITYYGWDVRSRTAAGNEITTIGAYNGEHIFEIKKTLGTEAKYYVDDVLKDTDTTRVPNASIPILLTKTGANNLLIDWVFAHKYVSPEPAFASAGAEQSAPSVGNPYWYYNMLKRRNS